MLVKEELIHYLIGGHIHLSRQDFSFFNNLEKIAKENKVTTGQNTLFDKLLDKYSKQLKKHNFNIEYLKKLPWKTPLLETRPEFQRAELSLIKDNLILKSPFNKSFNTALKKEFESRNFIWDRNSRTHVGTAGTNALKKILKLLPKHFKNYIICPEIENILEELKEYDDYIFTPTLVKKSGNLYVLGCNEILFNFLKNIELNEDPKTLFKLSQLGIKIDSELLSTTKLEFAGSYYTYIDIDDLDETSDWIQELGYDTIVCGQNLQYTRSLYKELKDKFNSNGISVISQNELKNLENKSTNILINIKSNHFDGTVASKFAKVIFLQSKRPINVPGLRI